MKLTYSEKKQMNFHLICIQFQYYTSGSRDLLTNEVEFSFFVLCILSFHGILGVRSTKQN